jgi:hypothetical protein
MFIVRQMYTYIDYWLCNTVLHVSNIILVHLQGLQYFKLHWFFYINGTIFQRLNRDPWKFLLRTPKDFSIPIYDLAWCEVEAELLSVYLQAGHL